MGDSIGSTRVQRLMILFAGVLIMTAVAACSGPQRSAECRSRINDCLNSCESRGDGLGPVESEQQFSSSDDIRTDCERSCHNLCY